MDSPKRDSDGIQLVDAYGNAVLVDSKDYELVKKYRWYMLPNGYFTTRVGGASVFLHRFIMNCPQGMEVDHINHNKRDCRHRNLRICTRFENARNRTVQSNNTSGYKGVSWHKGNGKWRARIKVHGRTMELGYYDTPEGAHEKYCEVASVIHGKYACIS